MLPVLCWTVVQGALCPHWPLKEGGVTVLLPGVIWVPEPFLLDPGHSWHYRHVTQNLHTLACGGCPWKLTPLPEGHGLLDGHGHQRSVP